MNLTHAMIANTCKGCVIDGSFTDEQRKELISTLERFENTKVSNIWKFTKYLKQFEDKYVAYGGNHELLESKIKAIRDQQYQAALKAVPGLKIEKKGD